MRYGHAARLTTLVAVMLLAGCGDMSDVDLQMSGQELSNNTHYDGFQITNYTVALESNYSGAQVCNSQGLSGCYYQDFLCSGTGVAMQGTGYANNGTYVKYVSGGGGWCGGYSYLCNCASAVFTTVSGVTGASGRTLVANYSIAVDPNYIPLGWYVWIDGLNRWYRADDTGGAIVGYRIDVYTGTSNPGYNFSSGIYLTSTAHNATDPSPYGGTVIVDDLDSGFTKYGPSSYWYQASIGYNSHMWYTYVNGSTQSNYARWKPTLSGAGYYTVYAYIPSNYATSQQAKYRIYHNGTNNYSTINQNIYYNAWVSLGQHYFSANGTEYVELSDATGEAVSTYRMIGFDAMKFVK